MPSTVKATRVGLGRAHPTTRIMQFIPYNHALEVVIFVHLFLDGLGDLAVPFSRVGCGFEI